MLFSDRPRTHYEKTLAHEVICQLRFPTILSINNVEPADFQERIREDFPQYARKQDVLPPQIVNGKPEPQPHQLPLPLSGRQMEAESHQGLHRPVHAVLPRLGGICPDAG